MLGWRVKVRTSEKGTDSMGTILIRKCSSSVQKDPSIMHVKTDTKPNGEISQMAGDFDENKKKKQNTVTRSECSYLFFVM